jgi:succinyl-CoA synthetase beta subunit
LNIHEYQAKELMNKFGIEVPAGYVVDSTELAIEAARNLGQGPWMVKAQIHAGGRGEAGGVKRVVSIKKVESFVHDMLGTELVTRQTGKGGKRVNKFLVEKEVDIHSEFYVGLTLDRSSGKITYMTSSEGGVEIETVAKNTPEKIITAIIDPAIGFSPYIGRKLAFGIGLSGDQIKKAVKVFKQLYELYTRCDCTLAEINPLVFTTDGEVMALDAKTNFDDSALLRHADIAAYRDPEQESHEENAAARYGLTYIGLDGNIGCLVNGAGLAMATMDIIKLYGGRPANFLDAGGNATKEAITEAFKIILSEQNVEAVLINIFAGILRCDIIAHGVVEAAKSVDIKVPLVVRLEGTNVDLGKEILENSGLAIISAGDLADAAEKVVMAARKTI